MKEKVVTFLIVFGTCFTLFYLNEDLDLGRFFFVSACVGVFAALTFNYSMKLVIGVIKKIVKPPEKSD
jgi:hypothetical protein